MGKELQVESTLPDDCWELIFRKLQGTSLKSISLVCKHFLSISNVCHNRVVTIYSSKRKNLHLLLGRFKNINTIIIWGLDPISTINETMFELASSGLINLQTLVFKLRCRWDPIPTDGWKALGLATKNLKYLRCPNFYYLDDDTLSAIASSMTSLKVLNMGTYYKKHKPLPQVSDRGIEILAASLPRLEEINISGFTLISDDSFVALSSKCKFLRVIEADGVPNISHHGIGFVLGHSPHLEKVNCKVYYPGPFGAQVFPRLKCDIMYEKALGFMRLRQRNSLNHQLVESIVKAKIPLKKLRISHCQHINVSGLIAFLSGHPSLTCLEIECNKLHPISDKFIVNLCPYLYNMKSICFIGHHFYLGRLSFLNLGRSSFFNLAQSCLSLEEFRVEVNYKNRPLFTWVSTESYSLDDDSVNGAEQKLKQVFRQALHRYYI